MLIILDSCQVEVLYPSFASVSIYHLLVSLSDLSSILVSEIFLSFGLFVFCNSLHESAYMLKCIKAKFFGRTHASVNRYNGLKDTQNMLCIVSSSSKSQLITLSDSDIFLCLLFLTKIFE